MPETPASVVIEHILLLTVAAIPAVIAYNKISSVLDNYSVRLETFAQEFVGRVTRK